MVYGVNHGVLKASHTVISNASCTTNCLAPLVKVLHEKVGVLAGIMNTIHSYTNDQVLTDVYHTDLRRARSATMSMIPTKDRRRRRGRPGAGPNSRARSTALRSACRPSTFSLVDLSFTASPQDPRSRRSTAPSRRPPNGALKGILAYNDAPLVSVDFNHDPASSTYDATLTKVIEGNLVRCVPGTTMSGASRTACSTPPLAWSKAS